MHRRSIFNQMNGWTLTPFPKPKKGNFGKKLRVQVLSAELFNIISTQIIFNIICAQQDTGCTDSVYIVLNINLS